MGQRGRGTVLGPEGDGGNGVDVGGMPYPRIGVDTGGDINGDDGYVGVVEEADDGTGGFAERAPSTDPNNAI